MKLSEYEEKLAKLRRHYGDLNVVVLLGDNGPLGLHEHCELPVEVQDVWSDGPDMPGHTLVLRRKKKDS